jgi:hypothetical protein
MKHATIGLFVEIEAVSWHIVPFFANAPGYRGGGL